MAQLPKISTLSLFSKGKPQRIPPLPWIIQMENSSTTSIASNHPAGLNQTRPRDLMANSDFKKSI